MSYVAAYLAKEALKDGNEVPIRAMHPDDKERLVKAFLHLHTQTIRMRLYYAKMTLSEDDLRWLDEISHGNHVGLVATVPSGCDELIIGEGSYVALGRTATIQSGLIRDVSLTTRVTQSATLHRVSTFSSRQVKCKRDDNPRHANRTMKQYKPLLSSAPANSILNAQEFHYRNSASTDIRKTFANFRRNASKQDQPSVATNVRILTKNPIDATPVTCSLASLRRSSG